ncbi:PREDICTED: E3 ubiquitin-protein ligase At4g11680-like isoform X1 [Lupinus angustifolius]|uniref:E3 ubiquitin-protein ligase At4g11680-like isoform X1 n=1 Tax=Lupinus angustifolius TaxID=3871 RepID=UPI00092EA8FB|nr:PREDICTED: E3 ubiquitin-protein ligase At4g11680-like isoform X1 [Lupinus angustifolius]
MAATVSSNRYSDDGATNRTPILGNSGSSSDESNRFSRRGIRQAARFLRQASGQRMMREPSMMVRETAAEQLEERQSDWAYSKPVVVLDILWNFAFVVTGATVLILSVNETPSMPLTVWVIGYALQCILHVVCVCIEFKKRRRTRREESNAVAVQDGVDGSVDLSSGSGQYQLMSQLDEEGTSSMAKRLESANTMFSFIWWVVGFYWVSAGGQDLAQDSPLLYWLCIVFLGFDVFFVVFCVALACFISIAVCCCLPCIIALLYAVADQDGATKKDIEHLSKYTFRRISNDAKLAGNPEGPAGGIMTECVANSPTEHDICDGDAECCICLSEYEDGAELRKLPCGHHFHCTCVDKWLHINATCPLCKYNILKCTEEV